MTFERIKINGQTRLVAVLAENKLHSDSCLACSGLALDPNKDAGTVLVAEAPKEEPPEEPFYGFGYLGGI